LYLWAMHSVNSPSLAQISCSSLLPGTWNGALVSFFSNRPSCLATFTQIAKH
jgi:hypothetical protein